LQGKYAVKNEVLKRLHEEALALLRSFERYELTHIPREQHTLADEMSNRAIDEQMTDARAPGRRPRQPAPGVTLMSGRSRPGRRGGPPCSRVSSLEPRGNAGPRGMSASPALATGRGDRTRLTGRLRPFSFSSAPLRGAFRRLDPVLSLSCTTSAPPANRSTRI